MLDSDHVELQNAVIDAIWAISETPGGFEPDDLLVLGEATKKANDPETALRLFKLINELQDPNSGKQ
jgi:hypothetical protein